MSSMRQCGSVQGPQNKHLSKPAHDLLGVSLTAKAAAHTIAGRNCMLCSIKVGQQRWQIQRKCGAAKELQAGEVKWLKSQMALL